MSDTIEIPDSLPYPKIQPITELKEISGKFCYILKYYPQKGIALTISRAKGNVCVRISDWTGIIINPEKLGEYTKITEVVMKQYSHMLINILQLIGVPKTTLYFSNCEDGPKLVDMRLSLNKFCGPGYLADFFGKPGIPVQEKIGDPIMFDKEHYDKIISKSGIYTDSTYIIKPSAFKFIIRGTDVLPMYGLLSGVTSDETKSAS